MMNNIEREVDTKHIDNTRQTDTRYVNNEGQVETGPIAAGNRTSVALFILIIGAIEILLAFRFGFKLLGANPQNNIIQGVYQLSQYIVGLFEGIFSDVNLYGIGPTAVFEAATMTAIVAMGLTSWGVMTLIKPHLGYQNKK